MWLLKSLFQLVASSEGMRTVVQHEASMKTEVITILTKKASPRHGEQNSQTACDVDQNLSSLVSDCRLPVLNERSHQERVPGGTGVLMS